MILKPAYAGFREEATAFKRDYQEPATKLAEEVADDDALDVASVATGESAATALFSDKAAADAASAKAPAAERQQSMMQGYTGNP